jgi:hypothetical protein
MRGRISPATTINSATAPITIQRVRRPLLLVTAFFINFLPLQIFWDVELFINKDGQDKRKKSFARKFSL